MSAQLKPGDIVKIRSGGPLMTIERIGGSEAVCWWFNQDEMKYEPKQSVFPLGILQPVDMNS